RFRTRSPSRTPTRDRSPTRPPVTESESVTESDSDTGSDTESESVTESDTDTGSESDTALCGNGEVGRTLARSSGRDDGAWIQPPELLRDLLLGKATLGHSDREIVELLGERRRDSVQLEKRET